MSHFAIHRSIRKIRITMLMKLVSPVKACWYPQSYNHQRSVTWRKKCTNARFTYDNNCHYYMSHTYSTTPTPTPRMHIHPNTEIESVNEVKLVFLCLFLLVKSIIIISMRSPFRERPLSSMSCCFKFRGFIT